MVDKMPWQGALTRIDALPSGVDRRLVARAQAGARGRVHELASLLNSYYIASAMLDEAKRCNRLDGVDELLHLRDDAECELRRFAFRN